MIADVVAGVDGAKRRFRQRPDWLLGLGAGKKKGKTEVFPFQGFEVLLRWLRLPDARHRPVVSAAGGSRLSFVADGPPFCPYCVSRVGDRTALSTSNRLPAEPVCLACSSAPTLVVTARRTSLTPLPPLMRVH